MKNSRYKFLPSLSLSISLVTGSLGASAAEPVAIQETDALPNYYAFFMKTGRQETLSSEAERNEQIASGDLAPVEVGTPAPDFKLPDGFGNIVGLRDYVGKKNIVLSTMRTWW